MSNPVIISTGYSPRPVQAEIHRNLKRFSIICAHRRLGKTHLAVNEIIDKALRNQLKNPTYAYVSPSYGMSKRIAWALMKDYLKGIPGMETNEADLRIMIPRPHLGDQIKIMLLSADNPDSLKGIYLDGVVIDEYAQCTPTVWSEALRPTLTDRLGWALFIGTPKGSNHFYLLYKHAQEHPIEWYSATFRADETGIIPEAELASNREMMSESEYAQEFLCSFSAANVGSYYGKLIEVLEKEKKIINVPYDPAVPVDTAWDLGVGDSTAIWFCQQVMKEIRIIDHYEMSGVGLDHYAKIIHGKPYAYREHILPHDGAARSMETGRTRQEVLRDLGVKTRILNRQSIEDGINAVRVLLPRMWFDETKTKKGIEALKNYQRKFDSKTASFSDAPLHNWSSNSADAMRYLCLGIRDESKSQNRLDLPRQAETEYDIYNSGAN